MVLPELGPGVWIGIGFGLIGITFWIGGLLLIDKVAGRFSADHGNEPE